MIPEDVRISHHALQRFQERYIDGASCKDPEATLRKLIQKNTREIKIDDKIRFKRFLNNNCVEVRYFLCSRYILIYSEKDNTIETFETKGYVGNNYEVMYEED